MWVIWCILGFLGILFIVYAVVPNVWTRMLHQACHSLPAGERQLALTFDDGPIRTIHRVCSISYSNFIRVQLFL